MFKNLVLSISHQTSIRLCMLLQLLISIVVIGCGNMQQMVPIEAVVDLEDSDRTEQEILEDVLDCVKENPIQGEITSYDFDNNKIKGKIGVDNQDVVKCMNEIPEIEINVKKEGDE